MAVPPAWATHTLLCVHCCVDQMGVDWPLDNAPSTLHRLPRLPFFMDLPSSPTIAAPRIRPLS